MARDASTLSATSPLSARRLSPTGDAGRREPSGVRRDRRYGYRPSGAGRAPPEASEVDPSHSERIDVRPDETGSNSIRPDQTRSCRIKSHCPEPAEVQPADRRRVPDDRDYPSVGELQPTWTRERLAELQKADPDIAIMREWLEAGVEPIRDRVMPCSTEVKSYVSQ